jgi:hypothetical protein
MAIASCRYYCDIKAYRAILLIFFVTVPITATSNHVIFDALMQIISAATTLEIRHSTNQNYHIIDHQKKTFSSSTVGCISNHRDHLKLIDNYAYRIISHHRNEQPEARIIPGVRRRCAPRAARCLRACRRKQVTVRFKNRYRAALASIVNSDVA